MPKFMITVTLNLLFFFYEFNTSGDALRNSLNIYKGLLGVMDEVIKIQAWTSAEEEWAKIAVIF